MTGSNFVTCSALVSEFSFFLISSLFSFNPRSADKEKKEELENLWNQGTDKECLEKKILDYWSAGADCDWKRSFHSLTWSSETRGNGNNSNFREKELPRILGNHTAIGDTGGSHCLVFNLLTRFLFVLLFYLEENAVHQQGRALRKGCLQLL